MARQRLPGETSQNEDPTGSVTGALSHISDDVDRQVLRRRVLAVPAVIAPACTNRIWPLALVPDGGATVRGVGANRIAAEQLEALVRLRWIAPGVLQVGAAGGGQQQQREQYDARAHELRQCNRDATRDFAHFDVVARHDPDVRVAISAIQNLLPTELRRFGETAAVTPTGERRFAT